MIDAAVRHLAREALILGHSDTRVTSAYYAELLPATARDEVLRAMTG